MRNKILILFCVAISLIACKKSDVNKPTPPVVNDEKLKLPHGQPIGAAVTKEIGESGGTITSIDGTMAITVPAGAVNGPVTFSVQEVENTLGTKAKSYRLKPEGMAFNKPITISYRYGAINFGNVDPRHLFLACQDEQGYYHSARNTKGNHTTQTLTVETTHFSDWTFYSMYEFLVNEGENGEGKVYLSENELATIKIRRISSLPSASDDLDDLLVPLTRDPLIAAAAWDLLPKKGSLNVVQMDGKAEYRAPQSIETQSEVIVTAMLSGNLGKDNEGNPVRQIQLVQPIGLMSDDYFIIEENGAEMAATEVAAELVQLAGIQINASFPNGTNLASYIYATSVGGFEYNMHGVPGKATLELVPADQKTFIVFRPEICDRSSDLIFSPGKFVITALPGNGEQYFEGNFTATLFRFDFCEGGGITKTISGKFKIKKKL